MSLHPRVRQPYVIQRGVDNALTLDIYDASQAQQTATAATVTIRIGSRVIVDAASATGLGPPISYTLTAATTADESLSDQVTVSWSPTIGGVVYTMPPRRGFLVRTPFRLTMTDTDLLAVDRNIADYRSSADSNFSWAIEEARERIERRLLKKGRRPWLIFDEWALFDALRLEALAVIYGSGRTGLQPTAMHTTLAYEKERQAEKEFAEVQFAYDEDETGILDTTRTQGPGGGCRSQPGLALARSGGPTRERRSCHYDSCCPRRMRDRIGSADADVGPGRDRVSSQRTARMVCAADGHGGHGAGEG